MVFGGRFRGSHGFVQVDQDYENDVLIAKGTIRTAGGPTFYDYTFVGGGRDTYQTYYADLDLGLPDDEYNIAIRSVGASFLERMTVVDGRMTFRITSRGSIDVEYFVFGPPHRAPAPPGNWGLVIRARLAQLRKGYDSRMHLQKIVGEFRHKPIVGLAGQDTGFNVAGRKLAVMAAIPSMQWRQNPGPTQQAPGSYVLCVSSFGFDAANSRIDVVPTGIAAGPAGSSTPGGQPIDSNYPETGLFYFVDVTGL